MKKLLLLVPVIIIAVSVTFCLQSCKCKKKLSQLPSYCDTCYGNVHGDTTQQIIIWRTPNLGNDNSFTRQWIADNINGDVKITSFCSSCDSSLMLLTGPGVKTFIQGNGGTKGGNTNCHTCPVAGDSLYWCVNYPLNFEDVKRGSFDSDSYTDPNQTRDTAKRKSESVSPSSTPGGFSDTAVNIAVFDTGIDPWDISQYLYNSTAASCLNPSANNGWNFPNNDSVLIDDYNPPFGHGEMVSRLIVDQATHYKLNGINILPVKTHGANGQSDLFSVLCGFAYAAERNAKIINASFGYYASKATTPSNDPNAALLKAYIKYYLTKNNILLVAAAGNKKFTDDGNLDNLNFYPASLAADPELPNVIAVTTVNNSAIKISPTENYSEKVVDIGVNANMQAIDHSGNMDYYFLNPGYQFLYERGSSYATPIISGILGSHYNMIRPAGSGNIKKADIFNVLLQPGSTLGSQTNFNHTLKFGVMLDNSKTQHL